MGKGMSGQKILYQQFGIKLSMMHAIPEKAQSVFLGFTTIASDDYLIGFDITSEEFKQDRTLKTEVAVKKADQLIGELNELLSNYIRVYEAVNQRINEVKVGSAPIDPDETATTCLLNVRKRCFRLADQAKDARTFVDTSGIKLLALLDAIIRITELEKIFTQLAHYAQEVADRIQIHDGLAEEAVEDFEEVLFPGTGA